MHITHVYAYTHAHTITQMQDVDVVDMTAAEEVNPAYSCARAHSCMHIRMQDVDLTMTAAEKVTYEFVIGQAVTTAIEGTGSAAQ